MTAALHPACCSSGRLKIITLFEPWEHRAFSMEEGVDACTHELADLIQARSRVWRGGWGGGGVRLCVWL